MFRMRFTLRSIAGIVLSLVAIVALVATALIVTNGRSTPGAHASALPVIHGVTTAGSLVSTGAPLVKNRNMKSPVIHGKRDMGEHVLKSAKSHAPGASTADPNGVVEGSVLKSFD